MPRRDPSYATAAGAASDGAAQREMTNGAPTVRMTSESGALVCCSSEQRSMRAAALFGIIVQAPFAQHGWGPQALRRAASRSPQQSTASAAISSRASSLRRIT